MPVVEVKSRLRLLAPDALALEFECPAKAAAPALAGEAVGVLAGLAYV